MVTGVTQISAGDRFTCALTSSGMYCWGQNSNGQLGNGSAVYSQPTPTLVDQTTMGTPTSIYAGSDDTCAISNNKLYCWGRNEQGLAGTGSKVQQTRPTLSNLANPKSVAIGYYHACAIDTSNKVLCSGYNAHNELAQFDLVTSYSYKPAVNPAITGATGITAGYYNSCATDSTGTLTCWGWAWGGYALTTPTLPNGVSALAADAGADESCAIGSDNKLYCWGANQLGEVTGSTMMTNPSKVAVGSAHICALNTTGIYCWGSTFSTTPGLVDFSTCGNNAAEFFFEKCDGIDLNGETCQTQGGFSGGTVSCNANCNGFDVSACTGPGCGNGIKEGSEACDGADLGGKTCADYPRPPEEECPAICCVWGGPGRSPACTADCITIQPNNCADISMCVS